MPPSGNSLRREISPLARPSFPRELDYRVDNFWSIYVYLPQVSFAEFVARLDPPQHVLGSGIAAPSPGIRRELQGLESPRFAKRGLWQLIARYVLSQIPLKAYHSSHWNPATGGNWAIKWMVWTVGARCVQKLGLLQHRFGRNRMTLGHHMF